MQQDERRFMVLIKIITGKRPLIIHGKTVVHKRGPMTGQNRGARVERQEFQVNFLGGKLGITDIGKSLRAGVIKRGQG